MMPRNIRQMAYFCEPEAFDAALDYWQRTAGVGPFWTAIVQPENQLYHGQSTTGLIETAMGYLGNLQIEVIRPLNEAASPWTEWRRPGLTVPPAGLFHHFMIETIEFDETVNKLVEGGGTLAFTADPPGGGGFAYVDARASFGCWIEVSENRPFKERAQHLMRDATAGWDGLEPRRSYFALMSEAQTIENTSSQLGVL